MKFASCCWAVAVAASIGSAPAMAAPVPLLPSGGGSLAGSFVQPSNGLFIDMFSFTPASVSGLVSVVLQNVSGPVSFFTASLNDQNFSFFPELGAIDFAFQANVAADVPLALTVFGAVLDADGNPTGTGSYRGTVSVAAAVPEPATLAMLLAGLGVLGFATSRRRKTDGRTGFEADLGAGDDDTRQRAAG